MFLIFLLNQKNSIFDFEMERYKQNLNFKKIKDITK